MYGSEPIARIGRRGLAIWCIATSVALVAFAIGVTGLGPLDDHRMLGMVLRGEDFGFYVMPDLGRLVPLTAQEYAALARIFGGSPKFFYLFSALKLIPCGFLAYHCLIATGARNLTVFVLWCVTLLSMGVANTLFRLSASELNLLILMFLLAWSSLKVLANDGLGQKNAGAIAALGLFAFFASLFYKELAFVLGGALGATEWLRYRRARKKRAPLFVYLLIATSAAYIAGYSLWRLAYGGGSYSSFHASSAIDVLPLFASSDPFLLFVVMPLAAYRVAAAAFRPASHLIYDSFLVAACAYICAYLALGMFNWYYLLPAYGFAVTGVAGLLARSPNAHARRVMLLVIALCGVNVLPSAISDAKTHKTIANNHYLFVKSLAVWLTSHASEAPGARTLILAGVSPGSGVEIMVSLKAFLLAFGVREESIDLRGSEPSDNAAISRANVITSTVQHQENAAPGDLLIFNPYQKHATPPPLQSPSMDEIYRSGNQWVFPRWSALEWIRECAVHPPGCVTNIERNRRYSGYSVFLVRRQRAGNVPTVELGAPSYRGSAELVPDRIGRSTSWPAVAWIENTGSETWPAHGRLEPGRYVHLAYRWFDDGGRVVLEGDRTPFPEPMQPGDKVKISLRIKSPRTPGTYRLVISPIQEGVRWFEGDGIGKTVDIY
jgi:hypothetical protein